MSISNKLSIEQVDLTNKRVLMRVDFNVPFKDGKISSDQRIVAAVPTIKYAFGKGLSILFFAYPTHPSEMKSLLVL